MIEIEVYTLSLAERPPGDARDFVRGTGCPSGSEGLLGEVSWA